MYAERLVSCRGSRGPTGRIDAVNVQEIAIGNRGIVLRYFELLSSFSFFLFCCEHCVVVSDRVITGEGDRKAPASKCCKSDSLPSFNR